MFIIYFIDGLLFIILPIFEMHYINFIVYKYIIN